MNDGDSSLVSKGIDEMEAGVKTGRKIYLNTQDCSESGCKDMSDERECRWCLTRISGRAVSLKKYGDFCLEKCARAYMEGQFCDYRDCTNEPFAEVYHVGKNKGWCYLCRRHFGQEKKHILKSGGFWCKPD